MRASIYISALLLFVAFLCITSCKRNTAPVGKIAAPTSVLISDIYKEHCSGCHGQDAKEFITEGLKYGDSFEVIRKGIALGYPENGMPAYGETFTSIEIDHLTRFIQAKLEGTSDRIQVRGTAYTSEKHQVVLEPIAEDLHQPWGMVQLPSKDMLITELAGELWWQKGVERRKISGLPAISQHGQGGLMDVILHPNFEENAWVYISYTKEKAGEYTTAIGRGRLTEDASVIDFEELFEALPYSTKPYHFGSRMCFDDSGYLFFSVGDRGDRDKNPQALDNHCGKIHRIHDDGTIPTDNPFVASAEDYASIFSYGHRNPQGMAIHPQTRKIWIHEHGPKGGDELNIPASAKNYGWPIISYGKNYSGTRFTEITHKEGMEQPVLHWTPSIAPCGMAFVSGDRYPNWKNNIMVGSLKFEYLERLEVYKDEVVHQERLFEGIGRLRNVYMAPDGYLYVAVEKPGTIYRVVVQ